MRIGSLDRRVTILRDLNADGTAADSFGEPVPDWQPLATVWAEVRDLRGEERVAAQQLQADLTTRIRIRYRPDVEPRMRLVDDRGRTYRIEAVIELGRREALEILASTTLPA